MINFILFLIGLNSFYLIMLFYLFILEGRFFNKTVLQILAICVFGGIISLKEFILSVNSTINPLWILIIIAIILISLLSIILYDMNKKGKFEAVTIILIKYFLFLLIGILVVSC